MDVHNAFLHGDLKDEVYMKLPQGFKCYDPSKGIELIVLIYVDDLLVCGNDEKIVNNFKEYLSAYFHMKDLGKLKYFLGIKVGRVEEGFMLIQRKYALDLIVDVGLLGSIPASTPMEQQHKLGLDTSPFIRDAEQYRRLAPREKQWEVALRVVKYLKGTSGQGIMLSSKTDLNLSVYCDADWSACPITRRSLSAYVTLVGDSPVSWNTKKQGVVSHSSAEAEYRSMAQATREVKWLRRL
ncbi:uncharacterized mitochondrial protein AtMg00810-like [Brassica napus]|uniref:uncharacterized mitochondrial protein AtMg00810-like n=1 Tax=Brassica napus TaxID=3708 RepID=UPI002078B336|nr:uncharacterized mitochondrial protein AtMg00810-like [Brassica napus]